MERKIRARNPELEDISLFDNLNQEEKERYLEILKQGKRGERKLEIKQATFIYKFLDQSYR